MAEDYRNQTPGQILRATRKKREISLFDAQEGTKIPRHLLESIERDEYHKLSGPLYVKSFLRNYAGWLGLDAEEILAVYELATGRPEPSAGLQDEVWSEDQVAVTRVGMAWGRLAAIGVAATVVLVLLVFVALRFFGGGGDDPEPTQPASRSESAAPPRQTVVTRSEPAAAADSGSTTATAMTTASATASEPPTDRVEAEVQPGDRTETAEARLARLTRDEFGGLAEESQPAPVPDPTPTVAETVQNSQPAVPRSTEQRSPPRRGDTELRFVGGESFPLVLRVLLPEPANCAVRRDDQGDAVPVIWPDRPTPPPAYNLRHGMAYAVEGGFVIYWGAEDHFTLTLERIRGAEVSLNGEVQPLADWRPGQTKLLDSARLARGGG